MVGQERSLLPLLATNVFGLTGALIAIQPVAGLAFGDISHGWASPMPEVNESEVMTHSQAWWYSLRTELHHDN
jgi:hypothetical protein